MKKKITIPVFALFLTTLSCYNDKEDVIYGKATCDPINASFAEDISPIISNSCSTVGCHIQGGSGNGIFENYEGVKAKVDNGSFKKRVLEDKDMPPSGSLSECQLEFISAWLEAGALNN